eukprot:TRINITY_DN1250_c0_g1_i2.p2 TRINITY_DN1250_c0_g1~~TRINITY_DN1250_c0_g1_i2.p2  ORF type:complete len:184 (+),score=33.54 TRINITY_DN1250_c0_g1_i2:453-1004(+)
MALVSRLFRAAYMACVLHADDCAAAVASREEKLQWLFRTQATAAAQSPERLELALAADLTEEMLQRFCAAAPFHIALGAGGNRKVWRRLAQLGADINELALVGAASTCNVATLQAVYQHLLGNRCDIDCSIWWETGAELAQHGDTGLCCAWLAPQNSNVEDVPARGLSGSVVCCAAPPPATAI